MTDCSPLFEDAPLQVNKPHGTIITIRFSTDNEPTPHEVNSIRNAIGETLNGRGELRNPHVLSISSEAPATINPLEYIKCPYCGAGFPRSDSPGGLTPKPILSEELWLAIRARMNKEQSMQNYRQGWAPPLISPGDLKLQSDGRRS